jgi:hypothetical protein
MNLLDELIAEQTEILAEYGSRESDIPVSHKYWPNKSKLIHLHNQHQATLIKPYEVKAPIREIENDKIPGLERLKQDLKAGK